MGKLTHMLLAGVLAAALGAALMVSSPKSEAQETPPPPHAIMIEEKLCIPLLIAFGNVASATAATECVNLYSPTSLKIIAGFLAMSNGRDDPILQDNPGTAEVEERADVLCVTDSDGDGDFCDPGDLGVDDDIEVQAQIDMRDDDLFNGIYELRASDFASVDLDANQLHELDGRLIILTFNDGDDQPMRLRPDDGVIEPPIGARGDDIACGSSTFSGVSFFDEDCDDDGVPGDGVKLAVLVPGTPPPELGPSQLRITEEDRETYLDFEVVGEPDDLTFTMLKPVATSGTAVEDCTFDLSVAGVVEALGNPQIAIVLVHALDRDGTQVANTLLDWETDPEELGFVFLPQTPTVDLGSFGKGFPQAICGDEGTGILNVTAMFSATRTIDPEKPDPDDSEQTIEITVLGPPDAASAVTVTPAQVACDGTQSAEVAVTLVDENGDLVANGHEVEFSLQVLGTANPITATTTDGIAKSIITPLAAIGTGAPVVITSGDFATSALVQCAAGSPQQPGATPGPGTGTGQPGSGISGPDTGSGGQLGGRGELNAWPAVALFVAAMGLSGARFGLRRVR
jgi:hypothetical protein